MARHHISGGAETEDSLNLHRSLRWSEITPYRRNRTNKKNCHINSIFKQRSCSIKVTAEAITHSFVLAYVCTLRLQMWKQLERVFVVERCSLVIA